MFQAAVDVRGNHKAWGLARSEVKDGWDALCRRARRHEGTTVVSHELLGAASERRVTAAMTMLRDLEVHVVVTARDPARQAAAEWQEGIRHGRRLTFEEFRERVLDQSSDSDYARRFRAAQDLPVVWPSGDACTGRPCTSSPARPAGAPDELLWHRFADVVGFDPAALPAGRAGQTRTARSAPTRSTCCGGSTSRSTTGSCSPSTARSSSRATPSTLLDVGRYRLDPSSLRTCTTTWWSSRSGGSRRSTRPGTSCTGTSPTWCRSRTRRATRHPDHVDAVGQVVVGHRRGTAELLLVACSGPATRSPASRATTPGCAASASGSGGC